MRYLTELDAIGLVRAGRTVEQFLPPRFEEGVRILRWISISKKADEEYIASLFEVIDQGDAEHLDLYSFSYVDPDLPFGKVHKSSSATDAFEYTVVSYLADRNKFVNEGIIQDEYADLK